MMRRMKRFIEGCRLILLAGLVGALAQAGAERAPREVRTESGVPMVLVPGGTFIMGDARGARDEKPPHQVTVRSFYIDKYEVTQEEYQRVMRANPSRWKGAKNPVDQVRWSDAVRYCNARSRLEGLQPCYDLKTWRCNFAANGYRLPTEAEWEYACRAGSRTRYCFGDDPRQLKLYAWMKENSGGRSRPVGGKLPNRWGLYDLHGNVAEWCNDFYSARYYAASPAKDPPGPPTGEAKVVRGGCFSSKPEECTSSHRGQEDPAYTDVCFGYEVYGFRCVKNAP
jgi:formylglycine-generating enzyme required for sulfatase activity